MTVYFLFPQYRVSDSRSTSGAMKSDKRPYLEAAGGQAVVERDLSTLELNTDVARPLTMNILLFEEQSDPTGRPIAGSPALVILTK